MEVQLFFAVNIQTAQISVHQKASVLAELKEKIRPNKQIITITVP